MISGTRQIMRPFLCQKACENAISFIQKPTAYHDVCNAGVISVYAGIGGRDRQKC
jgi:hypothetical protein